MSDQFYAVEFKSMPAATHNIAVFSLELEAQGFFDIIDSFQEIPEDYRFPKGSFVELTEINFHNKPYESNGVELLYINEWGLNGNHIPDVYNY